MEPELHSLDTDELEQDGMPSTTYLGKNGYLFGKVLPGENESSGKRKRDTLEESSNDSDSSVEIGDGSDSGQRQDSVDSDNSSGSSGTTGLESTLSDLDISDGESGTKRDQSKDGAVDLVQSSGNDETTAEANLDQDVYGIKDSAKTKVDLKPEGIDGLSGSHVGGLEREEELGHAGNNINLTTVENRELATSFDPLNYFHNETFATDEDGDTLLHIGIISKKHDFVIATIKSFEPCHLNILNNLFQTALHIAVLTKENDLLDIVQELIKARACPHLRDQQGRTPIHIACEQGDLILLRMMLELGWFCADMDERLNTIYPTKNCSAEKSKIFNIPNSEGQCCIHIAAIRNDICMLALLLAYGADVNLPDRKSGRTALHLATELGHTAFVEFLLNQTTLKIDKKTMGDETASAIAYVRKREDIYTLLRANGAKENFKYFAKFGVATAEIKTTEAANDG